MIRSSLSLALLSVMFPLAVLQPAAAQERPWTVEDVLALKSPGDVAISPDGRWIAFVVAQRDLEENRSLSDIWLVGAEGGEAIQLTVGARDAREPAWAPDGSWLAFLSKRDSVVQVHGIRPIGGEAWPVTSGKEAVTGFAISPDGLRLAYTSRREASERDEELKKKYGEPVVWDSARSGDWTELRVAPVEDRAAGEAERVSPDGRSVTGFVWAPDSRRLAWGGVGPADSASFPSRDRPTGLSHDAQVYVSDAAESSTPRRVTHMAGGASPAAWVDGLGLLVAASGHTLGTYNRRLWLVPTESAGEPVELTAELDENARYVAADADAMLVESQ
ncbi:MAG: TolB family protein, partial [Longimicrobiales bacterium]